MRDLFEPVRPATELALASVPIGSRVRIYRKIGDPKSVPLGTAWRHIIEVEKRGSHDYRYVNGDPIIPFKSYSYRVDYFDLLHLLGSTSITADVLDETDGPLR